MEALDLDKALSQFGNQVRLFRKELDISQEDLANLCELDRTYIGGIERGERNVSLKNIIKIASALQIEPYKLLLFEKES